MSPRSKHVTAHLCVCVAALFLWAATPVPPNSSPRPTDTRTRQRLTTSEIDAALQRAATLALGGRDGTILVLDAQTGRLRAAVNEHLAASGAFPPGSAVKPFTLLAALRRGVVTADTRLLCRKRYRRGATEFSCAHPVYKTLFDTAHALAHSCNYFFAHLGERLTTEDFDRTLAPFGFGPVTDEHDATTHDANARDAASRRATPRGLSAHDAAARVAARLAHRARPTRAGASVEELAPQLPRGEWRTETALGEGGAILVTPLQLVAAYAALVNGGRLFEPLRADAAGFEPHERARIAIADDERAVVVAGMRGAVSYGTAERARLDSLPLRVFGKTGTATEIGGFRTHGWFVGFASDPRPARDATNDRPAQDATSDHAQDTTNDHAQDATNDQPAPGEVRLAVLVFLRRAQGKECAELSRPIFEEYARLAGDETTDVNVAREGDASGAREGDAARAPVGVLTENLAAAPDGSAISNDNPPISNDSPSVSNDRSSVSNDSPSVSNDSSSVSNDSSSISRGDSATRGDETNVRVRLSRDGETVSMPLAEYLFGVLAAEASTEDEYAAVKALAVVSRTYALQKLGRHAREGFDFCTTTHCERYLRVTPANARTDFHAMLRRAVAETEGQVLRDSRGHLAAAYFSASCGGMTANTQTLWGVPAREPFERGVADEYCAALPSTRWTDAIPARDLLSALRADPRTDVGSHLDAVTVLRRDATGRAELVALAGERRKVVRGWDFKIVVGRTLGWSVVKSSRFSVERAGARFVFRGTGFGHGLGLCQAGAHVMARGGSTYLQILAHYFPGATVGRLNAAHASADADAPARDQQQPPPRWKADATAPLYQHAAPRRYSHAPQSHCDATQRHCEARQRHCEARQRHCDASQRHPQPSQWHSQRSQQDSRASQCHFLAWEYDARAWEWRSHAREWYSLVREWRSHVREWHSHGSEWYFPASESYSHGGEWHSRAREWHPREGEWHSHARAGAVAPADKGSSARVTLSSEHFRVSFPARSSRRAAESVLRTLEGARADLAGRLDAASVRQPTLPVLEINVSETTGEFVAATGQPSWVAAATRGARIELQPLATLERRGTLAQTLRHEYAHACIDALSRGRAPLWLSEGLAAHFAGEGALLSTYAPAGRVRVEEIERGLAARGRADEMRALYAAAYAEVRALIRSEGEPRVWRRVAGSS